MSDERSRGPRRAHLAGGGWRGAALIFGLALAARLAVVAWAASRIPPTADGTFYHTIASRIARGLGYTWLWPDGAVTNAGHYPIGYPALVGAAYALLGPHPAAAMLLNALLGSLAAVAAYRLAACAGGVRAAWLAGVLVALHPGLVAYTPALMTEGVTASLVACAAWAAGEGAARASAGEGRARVWRWAVVTGVITGLATLVRPQSLVLAPVFGWLAAGGIPAWRASRRAGSSVESRSAQSSSSGAANPSGAANSSGAANPSGAASARIASWWRSRRWSVVGAAMALGAALAVCAPWTVRNCVAMKRCALVSHNGGWNLLIGTNPKGNGAWAELEVPPECREVFDEAEKDVCFGAAARRIIAERPGAWLALAPRKLAVTFDYAGAGGWYLHAASASAFPERAKTVVGAVETVFERIVLLLALFVAVRAPLSRLRNRARERRGAMSLFARGGVSPSVRGGASPSSPSVRGGASSSAPGGASPSAPGGASPSALGGAAPSARGGAPARAISARDLVALALALAGSLSAFLLHAWVGYVVLGVLLLAASAERAGETVLRPAATRSKDATIAPPVAASPGAPDSGAGLSVGGQSGAPGGGVLIAAAGVVVLSLAVVHAVFFGAGRYSLVAFPLVTAVAALGVSRARRHARP